MNKTKLNYWVDVVIGIAGVMSAVSGLVFLLPANPASGIMGISLRGWNTIHTWSSLAAIAGVGVHLTLHWKWVTVVTRQMLRPKKQRPIAVSPCDPVFPEVQDTPISRRAFLVVGGAMAVITGLAVIGYRRIAQAISSEDDQIDNLSLTSAPQNRVACPFGLVNDPYPGQCRRYLDLNGDGICDYSVPDSGGDLAESEDNRSESGDDLSESGEGGFTGGSLQRRGRWRQP